jgi:hypothetical protein
MKGTANASTYSFPIYQVESETRRHCSGGAAPATALPRPISSARIGGSRIRHHDLRHHLQCPDMSGSHGATRGRKQHARADIVTDTCRLV